MEDLCLWIIKSTHHIYILFFFFFTKFLWMLLLILCFDIQYYKIHSGYFIYNTSISQTLILYIYFMNIYKYCCCFFLGLEITCFILSSDNSCYYMKEALFFFYVLFFVFIIIIIFLLDIGIYCFYCQRKFFLYLEWVIVSIASMSTRRSTM